MAAFPGRNQRCNSILILLILACVTLMFPPTSAADSFTDPGRWEYFNLTTVHPALKAGFSGGVAHGAYVYYVPAYNGTTHGWAVRYDTTKPFTSAPSWEYLNLQTLNNSLTYFFGGVAHGDFVYYAPQSGTNGWNTVRYDTTKPFTSPAAWSWFNMSKVNVSMRGYIGIVASGDALYYVPYYQSSAHGITARYDTTQEFTSPSSWSYFNMTTLDPRIKGYQDAAAIGNYVYYIPYFNGTASHGMLVRYDTTGGFTDPAAWSFFDMATLDSRLVGYEGGTALGNSLYPSPSTGTSTSTSMAVRYDATRDFTSPSAYSYFNLTTLDPNLAGYLFNDALGDFVYYAPFSTTSGWAVRYNTSEEFTSPQAWSYFNITSLNGTMAGFFGCVGSGNYMYYLPFRWGPAYPGLTARFYALSAPGASFTASPLSGTAPLTVTFTDASILSPASWSWTFGDGGTSTARNPSHTYESDGTYTVSLTVTNAEGSDTMTRTGSISVEAPAGQTGSSGSTSIGATSAAAVSRLSHGEGVQFTFPNPAMPVRSVTFTAMTDTGQVLITAVERSIPAGVLPPEVPVYRYLDIQTYHLPEDAVTGAVIAFQVPRSWISSQHAEPRQVVLLRNHADAWAELPTEFIEEQEGMFHYRAVTPGFSLFAIGVNLSRGTPEAAVTATTVPTRTLGLTPTPPVSTRSPPSPSEPEPSPPDDSLLHTVILIGAVVVLVVAVVAWRYTLPRPIRRNRGGWL